MHCRPIYTYAGWCQQLFRDFWGSPGLFREVYHNRYLITRFLTLTTPYTNVLANVTPNYYPPLQLPRQHFHFP
jgi:hypothetical protein